MVVDSKLELFTTLFGWLFYNSIWEVLVATGIVYLPFIGIVMDTVISVYRNEDAEEAGNTSLRVLEVDFFIAFFVLMIAASPVIPLSSTELSYTPRAVIGNPNPETSTPAASRSTYGSNISFVDYPNRVDVPVFWYAVMSFTTGFNRAIIEDIPPSLDLREYANDLRELNIDDPVVQAEINDFFRDCYIEARSKYLDERPNTPAINDLQDVYGETDTEWMGSHIFLETSGFYDTLRSDTIRKGFPYSQLRDLEWDVSNSPVFGKPFCSEWWADENIGLAQKILDTTNNIELVAAAVEIGWDGVQRRDAIIKAALLNSPARWTNRGYDHAYLNFTKTYTGDDPGFWGALQSRSQQALAGAGLAIESLNFAAWVRILLESVPMLQALILMGLYALLPFFIILSRYRIQVLSIGALIFFIVKFWTVLWFFAWWTDQNLIRAFYPDAGDVSTLFNIDMTLKRVILNFLTGLMYVVFPLLFTTYLAFAGINAARGLDGVATAAMGRLNGASNVTSKMTRLLTKGKGKGK